MSATPIPVAGVPAARAAAASRSAPFDERASRAADPAAGFAALLAGVLAPTAAPPTEPSPLADPTAHTLAEGEAAPIEGGAGAADGDEPGVGAAARGHATARARTSRGVTHVSRDLSALEPEFRARFERVVERMQAEHGHEVRVTETVRDAARQHYLYEQGRTRPGPVVTWTLNSNHLSGRAADVIIDGSYDDAAAYARLGRIAEEEGLRTLGPRDPGHVELPRGAQGSARFAAAAPPAPASVAAGGAQIAQLAAVAPVARVAAVARVAEVAKVAEVAEVARVAGSGGAVAAAEPAGAVLAARGAGSAAGTGGRDARGAAEEQAEHGAHGATDAASHRAAGAEAFAAAAGERHPSATEAAAPRTTVVGGGELTARLAQVLDAQQPGDAARRIAHMVLRLDNPAGGEDTIRVDLRGAAVDARIEVGDAGAAQRMHLRVDELRRALAQKGLEAEALRVRAAPRPAGELVEATRLASAVVDEGATRAGRAGGDSAAQRERGHAAPDPEARRDPHSSRQRSRRNPQEGDLT